MDIITLHRDDARHAFFPGVAQQPLFYDETTKAWVACAPQHCQAMLLSPRLAVSPYRDAYEEMARRNASYGFPNMLFAFRYIPMCLNGEEHKAERRRIAEYLAARKEAIAAAAPHIIERWFGTLGERTEIELMSEAIEPMVKDVLAVVNDTDEAGRALIRNVSAVFDRMMGPKKRRHLDNELASIRALIRKSLGPGASEHDEGLRLALFVLGNDALGGSTGESLHRLFAANRGRRLSEIAYPAVLPATSVPFVERIVAQDFDYQGIGLRQGERVRIMLQSLQYSADNGDRLKMFGSGIHACLGRQLSLDIWSRLTKLLSNIDKRVDVIDYRLRDYDYVFTYPSRLSISLSQ